MCRVQARTAWASTGRMIQLGSCSRRVMCRILQTERAAVCVV